MCALAGRFKEHFGRDVPQLDWTKRMQLALDAARGLAFLHDGAQPAVIHRDFKSSNVLVDDQGVTAGEGEGRGREGA